MKIKKMKPNNNFLSYKIAHRGLHNESVSENSLEAFKLAIENGYAIELDIHLMKDNVLAVFHDESLLRMTGKEGVIEQLSEAELINFPLKDGQLIPTLKQVFDLVKGQVPILIELKFGNEFDHRQADALLEILKTYSYDDMIALQSFHPYAVKYLKERTDKYSVGYLCSYRLNIKNRFKLYLLKSLKLYKKIHADFISYDINFIPNKYVLRKQKRGETLFVWTINDYEKLEKARQYADNIIFEMINPKE